MVLPRLERLHLFNNSALAGEIPRNVGNLSSLVSLQLQAAALTGTVPSGLGALSALEELDLDSNLLTGTIPPELSHLTNLLELQLYSNDLEGSIPEGLGELQSLQYLYLHHNQLTNTIPASLGQLSSILFFMLYENNLNGTIPSSLGRLEKVLYLYVNDNELSGPIPPQLGNLSDIRYLWVHDNTLTGTLPVDLGKLGQLFYFAAHDNNLHGPIPPEFGGLTGLRNLLLYHNSLSHSLPEELMSLRRLKDLRLSFNKFSGPIPDSVKAMISLQSLRLHDNYITGQLPPIFPPFLEYISVENNLLNGSLPTQLGDLTRMETLLFEKNGFTGSLPVEWSQMNQLQNFYIGENSLSGSIPVEYGSLLNLGFLSFASNILTGSVPESFGNLTSLKFLDLYNNSLSSSLPVSLGGLSELEHFWLHANHFTGTLPSELFSLRRIFSLWLQDNLFSGSIPKDVGLLPSECRSLIFTENLFTGTIPLELFQSTALTLLSLSSNMITGPLPSQIGNLQYLFAFRIHYNLISGLIPSSIGQLLNVRNLDLSFNLFSSTIPYEVGNLVMLFDLFLSNNELTGSLDALVWQAEASSLVLLDVASNTLSGRIPARLFDLPFLTTVSLSVNCFEGPLPDNLCDNRGIEVLAMDGLAASSHCSHSYSLPFSQVRLFNKLGGTIPTCVFSLENLTSLHMMANGLTGSLHDGIAVTSSLQNLVLSHNDFGGSIPSSVQQKSFAKLDMSYNKISGTYDDYDTKYNQSELILEVNRLSGNVVSSALRYVGTLKLLQGNMFGCQHNPRNDEYYREFSCGSMQLNDAMYVWLSLFCSALLCMVGIFVAKRCGWFGDMYIDDADDGGGGGGGVMTSCVHRSTALVCNAADMMRYPFALMFPSSNEVDSKSKVKMARPDSLGRVVAFCGSVWSATKAGVFISAASLVLFIPFYGLKLADGDKASSDYVTHSNIYGYMFTMAYISGVMPAVLLLLGWSLLLFLCGGCYFWIKYRLQFDQLSSPSNITTEEQEVEASVVKKSTSQTSANSLLHGFYVVLDVVVVGSVNGLYLYSTYANLNDEVRVYIQICFSLFYIFCNLMFVPLLASSIKVASKRCYARLLMLIMNNIFIPCIVTALASPSCFRGVFEEVDSITPVYNLYTCTIFEVNLEMNTQTCTMYDYIVLWVTPIVPPFSYRYECSSVLISAYIPVFFFMCAFEVLLVFLFVGFSLVRNKYVIQKLSVMGKMGILWPHFWSKLSNSANKVDQDTSGNFLLNTVKLVTNDMLYYGAIQSTFGLISPVLTVAIATTFCLKLSMWLMLLGRFLQCRVNLMASQIDNKNSSLRKEDGTNKVLSQDELNQLNTDHALCTLSAYVLDVPSIYVSCFWPMMCTSSLFVASLSWDMAGDKVSNALDAVWAPVTALTMPLLLWGFDIALHYRQRSIENSQETDNESGDVEIVEISSNPLCTANDI